MMNTSLYFKGLIALGLTAVLCALVMAAPPERTLSVDAVELIAGREVPGKPELSIERDGIEYHFASLETKAAFEKEPAKYEVADGGACGRMGPLSGLGDARRYAVHDKRIYFFASDGCRAGFLREPAKYIETDDDKVFGSNDQVLQGRATFDKMIAWAGGADRIRALTSFRATGKRVEKSGDKDWNVSNETSISFPARFCQKEAWNESWFSTTSAPEGIAMASTGGAERIAASRGRAFNRGMARWPVVLMRAYIDGAPMAECPGLIVIADGEGKLGDVHVVYVKIWLNGAASRLTIDKASGRLLQLAFRGRDASVTVGDSVRTYTSYATVEGITLPTGYSVNFDSKDQPGAASQTDSFEVNPKLPAELFAIPK